MTQDTVYQLEREVEASRAKLAHDLTVLRSPETAADFTQALKQEAKSGLDATIQSIIEDVKGRAAANPAAALAIGAGLAWRLIRHPPIATALIGAGLVSLFRTPPTQASNGAGYLSHAKSRLEEQASQVAHYAAEQAAQMSTRAKENAAELASAAKERAREWAAEATSSGRQAASGLEQRAAAISSQASDVMGEMRDRATAATRPYAQSAGQAMQSAHHAMQSAGQAINEPEARDKLLLGGAGVAIVAAMSIALHRRFREVDEQL
jgi:hypothetical protein